MKPNTSLPATRNLKPATPLRLVVAGHVDHGKSTLVGRLLHETGSLAEGKRAAIEASCKKRGQPFEWAFVTDALQAERDQNVTIEAAHIILKAGNRDIVLIDAPGHHEFLKNMATGIAAADAALLLIDAQKGISQETRTHAALMRLLGIRQVVVAINKMDQVRYDRKVFNDLSSQVKTLGLKPIAIVPISAREGDNVSTISPKMKWYKGKTLLQVIEKLPVSSSLARAPLRLPVQDVYKSSNKRILVGRVESGRIARGDMLLFSPANTKAKVTNIERWKKKATSASAGESVGFTIDKPLFIERGQVASHEKHAPFVTNHLKAQVAWLDKTPLAVGDSVQFRVGTDEKQAELCQLGEEKNLQYGEIKEAVFRLRGQIAVDEGELSRFVLVREQRICGVGRILVGALYDQRREQKPKPSYLLPVEGINRVARAKKNGHFGGIIWLTGLSSSGKSTIAMLAQKKLFARGCQIYVLDGDNIRQGLSRDLNFTPKARRENTRRAAEAAALFADAGMIAIAAFISPYEEEREKARTILPQDFHAIYVRASLATCEARDPKGLYRQARAGKIKDFTGIDSPYEEPKLPDLVLDTEAMSAEACADALVAYITRHLIEPAKGLA